MSNESQMVDLANAMSRAHGILKEVVFLNGNKNILLIFSDKLILPTDCNSVNDVRGNVIQAEFMKYPIYGILVKELGGQSPLGLLAYGYSGTGPKNLSKFLHSSGFKNFEVENITPPLRLLRDGSEVHGVIKDEIIEWEDGKNMFNAGMGEMPKFIKEKKWWKFWE
jgi:hypothetical protein